MKLFPKFVREKQIDNIFFNKEIKDYFINCFEKTFNCKVNTWDYQWYFARLMNGGISIFLNTNLVENIGFHINALHTKNMNDVRRKNYAYDINFPLKHIYFKIPNYNADLQMYNNVFKISNYVKLKDY